MATTIGFIRHGVTEWNNLGKTQGMTDVPLNEEGIKQATAFCEKWEMIFSSKLTRARQTAEIIRQSLGVASAFTDLGMEEYQTVARRGLTFLEELILDRTDKRILIISHRALIGISLQYLLPQRFQKTNIDNTSLTILTHTNNDWECQLYNCTNHLKVL